MNIQKLSSLGPIAALEIFFDHETVMAQIGEWSNHWSKYNPRKDYKRYGLSLTTLDGSLESKVDLDSLREHNLEQNTNYNELSFRCPTDIWRGISSISSKLLPLEPFLGRSHILRLDKGGFFPPHRDLGSSFRLIAFFNCSPSGLVFMYENNKFNFEPCALYYMDTRRAHSLFSFQMNSFVLVLNVDPTDEAIHFVYSNLLEK